MSTTDSTTNGRPAKPNPGFPLYAHRSGCWAKKIRGKTYFFGPWRDPDGALGRYLAERDDLEAGLKPRREKPRATVAPADNEPIPVSCPAKPYADFPLYPHKSRRWAKKIRGKTHFFGPWRDPHQALTRYLAEKDDLEAGRPVRASVTPGDSLTVKKMVAAYLAAKKLSVECGDMTRRTLCEYKSYGTRMIKVFGANTSVEQLGPRDFQRLRADLQKTHKSLFTIQGDIPKIKVYFSWAERQGYISRAPRYGDAMARPSRAALERERSQQPSHVFAAGQLQEALASAGPKMKAMILLGINCGFGNTDCATLTEDKLDLKGGWSTLPRRKTGIKRRCPLWPETIDALREALRLRKVASEHVFLTIFNEPYSPRDLSRELTKVLEKAEVGHRDFYDLRRTCVSIGIQVGDDDALRTIMGHRRVAADMLSVYNRLDVSDERLRAVSNYIHDWLFGSRKNSRKPRKKKVDEAESHAVASR